VIKFVDFVAGVNHSHKNSKRYVLAYLAATIMSNVPIIVQDINLRSLTLKWRQNQ